MRANKSTLARSGEGAEGAEELQNNNQRVRRDQYPGSGELVEQNRPAARQQTRRANRDKLQFLLAGRAFRRFRLKLALRIALRGPQRGTQHTEFSPPVLS